MKRKQLFIQALSTLFYSWGSDTPPEAVWAANELLDWYEMEYNIELGQRFEEDAENNHNYDSVIMAIEEN